MKYVRIWSSVCAVRRWQTVM